MVTQAKGQVGVEWKAIDLLGLAEIPQIAFPPIYIHYLQTVHQARVALNVMVHIVDFKINEQRVQFPARAGTNSTWRKWFGMGVPTQIIPAHYLGTRK